LKGRNEDEQKVLLNLQQWLELWKCKWPHGACKAKVFLKSLFQLEYQAHVRSYFLETMCIHDLEHQFNLGWEALICRGITVLVNLQIYKNNSTTIFHTFIVYDVVVD
jgi:hypothetical protein